MESLHAGRSAIPPCFAPGYIRFVDLMAMLHAHGPYLSDRDEAEIEARLAAAADIADLALRTCLCGVRMDGFDEYHAHLVQVFGSAIGGRSS